MIALLSVGEAIVEQARDKDLVGGGGPRARAAGHGRRGAEARRGDRDVPDRPERALPAPPVAHGPALLRRTCAPRRADVGGPARCSCARRGRVIQSLASAGVPSLERRGRASSRLPRDVARHRGEARFATLAGARPLSPEMDRWHRPAPAAAARTGPSGTTSTCVDPASGRVRVPVVLRRRRSVGRRRARLAVGAARRAPGTPPVRYVTAAPVDSTAVPLDGVGARLGPRA